jgi:hypothetical protein
MVREHLMDLKRQLGDPVTHGYLPPVHQPRQGAEWVAAPSASSNHYEHVPETHDPTAAQVRNAAATRLQFMNSMHAVHAWERRRSKPIGTHALAFLYADPDPRSSPDRPHYEVRSATRLFLDGDEVRDLVQLLYEMCDIAYSYLANNGIFDPLVHMTQRVDEMSGRAVYVGVGVSSLNTAAGSWEKVQTQVGGALEIPGRCFVVLTDTTRILIERPARPYDPLRILSTKSLNVDVGIQYRPWRMLIDDPNDTEMIAQWQWLSQLNDLVMEGQRRMAAARGSRHQRQ